MGGKSNLGLTALLVALVLVTVVAGLLVLRSGLAFQVVTGPDRLAHKHTPFPVQG